MIHFQGRTDKLPGSKCIQPFLQQGKSEKTISPSSPSLTLSFPNALRSNCLLLECSMGGCQVFEATALVFSQWTPFFLLFASHSLSSCLYFVLLSMSSGNFLIIYTRPIYMYIRKFKHIQFLHMVTPISPTYPCIHPTHVFVFFSPSLPSRWKSEVVRPDRLGLRKNDEVLVSQGIQSPSENGNGT